MKHYFLTRLAIFVVILASNLASSSPPVPADKSGLDKWFSDNIKPLSDRTKLDPALVDAEKSATVVKVRADGSGDFKTISEAINSVPADNKKRVLIWIGGGVYKEKLKIERNKPFITLYGSPNEMPTLTFNGDAKTFGTVDSGTLTVLSDYFVAANIIFKNSSPRPNKHSGGPALAARLMGTKAAIYNCKFYGFQDTLCDDAGMHLFKDCFIQGSTDFIFGRGTSLYLNCQLDVVIEGSVIAAHSRELEHDGSGYSFVHCSVTGPDTKKVYLGRAWRPRSKVIYSYTKMANNVRPEGWHDMGNPKYTASIHFGEYKNSGPGSDTSQRVSYSKRLSDAEAKPYLSLSYIEADKWLLPPPNSRT